MSDESKPELLTLENVCKRIGLGWPLPKPGTPEAEKWCSEKVGYGEADPRFVGNRKNIW